MKNKKINLNNKIFWNKLYNKFFLNKLYKDQIMSFDYKLVNVKNTGLIFVISTIILPCIVSILTFFIFTKNNWTIIFTNLVNSIIVSIGGYFIFRRVWKKIIYNGAISFYFFYFIPNILMIITNLILNLIKYKINNTILLIINLLSNIICIFLTTKVAPSIFIKIKLTIKYNLKILIYNIIIWIIILFIFNLFFNIIQNIFTFKTSDNQNNLILGLNKWWNFILIFIFSIITAPIIEELACRHSVFSLCGNKWLGYFSSIIYFSSMHIIKTGDWIHLISYMGGSIILTTLFIFAKGNITFTIFLHSFWNFIIFIYILFNFSIFKN